MNLTVFIESLLNILDFGAFIESFQHYRKRTWDIDPGEIIRHMVFGKGYREITPPRLTRMISQQEPLPHLIDLREYQKYLNNHIENAVSKPIEEFLKEIYKRKFRPPLFPQTIILVCDTGQLSRFAASVLTKEGFARVYSLKGGMRRWNRWVKLSRNAIFAKADKTAGSGWVNCC